MYKYYNPHPNGKKAGDCVKRALTLATGKEYQEVSRELNKLKREIGGKAYNSNNVWKEYVERFGYKKIKKRKDKEND